MPAPLSSDTNIGFSLTGSQRQRVMRVLDGLVDGLSQGSSILIDRAGRIVEVARKPVGIELPAISALAAGCFATTHELASAMGENEYSLLFQHENDQQVMVWPVGDRALLVALLSGSSSVETLESRLAGDLGSELIGVVKDAEEPPKNVPPPRVQAPQIPAEVKERTRALTALIMDLQVRRPDDFTPRVNAGLLSSREQLVQALSRRDWRLASEICEATRQSLLRYMHLSSDKDAGQVVTRLYAEIFEVVHESLQAAVPPDRLNMVYTTFFHTLSKRWPRVYVAARGVGQKGVDVGGLWVAARALVPDAMQLAPEFVTAMDAMVRELLRAIYLSKGPEGRQSVLKGATEILKKHSSELLPFGLEGLAGRDWAMLASN